MTSKTFSRQNLDFILHDVLNIAELAQYELFAGHDAQSFGFALDTASDIAEKTLRPFFADSDRKQPECVDGQVKVHPAMHAFVKAYAEAGLLAAPFPPEWQGVQLPKTIAAAAEYILGSAHNSAVMYTDLTKGAANLILRFGTLEQKRHFLPKMLSGEWLGTMCLTETQAGSSLSDVATTATPQADGTYKIKGQKIFISAGDQDISENILHLVLARIDGAPKGTKGISLFVVPKMQISADFGIEHSISTHPLKSAHPQSNDVAVVTIYHKMGQKATPAAHLEFGANNNCTGYLLGEANRGLPQMFLMMNAARLGVGSGGIQIASAAYHASLQYAQERTQGRRLSDKNPMSEPVPIIQHPDVRRMLFLQKAIVEGGLCFILQCFKYLDLEKCDQSMGDREGHPYRELLELLTPVAKTYGAEMGFVSTSQAVQVLGGYGYTEDFELEQLLRDCRIMSLYEGTTGIQSQALLGRQVLSNQGRSLLLWYHEVAKDLQEAEKDPFLGQYWQKQMDYMRQFQQVNSHIFKTAALGDMEIALADANLYMEAFGLLNVGWQWLKQGIAARRISAEETSMAPTSETSFPNSKIQTLHFYFHYEMPRLSGLFQRLTDETVLTVFDEKSCF